MIKISSIIHFLIFTAICGVAISYSSLYLFHIVLVFLILAIIIISTKKEIYIKVMPTKLHHFFVFMFCYYIFTLIWTISVPLTATYIFYIACGSFLALTIIYYGNNEETLNKIFKVSSIAFSLEILLSLLEVFTPFRLPVSPFSSYLEFFGRSIGDESIGRTLANSETIPTGFQWNPNNLSTTMAIIFPFFLLHKNRKVKWLGVISILILISASSSRANLLAIVVMLLVSFFFSNKRKFLISLSIITAPFYILYLVFSQEIKNYFYSSSLGYSLMDSFASVNNWINGGNETGDSIDVRKSLLREGLNALKETYGVGVGGGASKVIHEGYGESAAMHNFWMEILVEAGVLFFVVFIIWYLIIGIRLLKISVNMKNTKLGYYSSATLIAMIGFIPASISASSTIYLLPMWLMFGFAIAVVNTYYKKMKSRTHGNSVKIIENLVNEKEAREKVSIS